MGPASEPKSGSQSLSEWVESGAGCFGEEGVLPIKVGSRNRLETSVICEEVEAVEMGGGGR